MTFYDITESTARRQAPGLFARIARWVALARQRRQLARLDNAALSDIGVAREEADREARRPFWDAPENWRI